MACRAHDSPVEFAHAPVLIVVVLSVNRDEVADREGGHEITLNQRTDTTAGGHRDIRSTPVRRVRQSGSRDWHVCEDYRVRYLTIEIPVRLWQRVDGCVDNSMAVDAVDGITETVIAGSCIRDAGWRASAASEAQRDSYGWPPREHLLVITLRLAHWEWVLSQLDRWEPYATDGMQDDAEVRAIISTALTAG